MPRANQQGTLRQFMMEWAHRDDLSNAQEILCVENAAVRIGGDLRTRWSESQAVLTTPPTRLDGTPVVTTDGEALTTSQYLLPGDTLEIISVYDASGRWLPYLSGAQIGELRNSNSSDICGFTTESFFEDPFGVEFQTQAATADLIRRTSQTADYIITVYPATGEDITIRYFTYPKELTATNTKSPVLVSLQPIYLRAALMEVHMFVQDWEQFGLVREDYDRMVAAYNQLYDRARISAGSTVSYPRRVFQSNGPVRSM